MNIGYSFWGHLADIKMKDGKLVSTPDGNAFYSWCIISELQKRGHTVYRMMPDRDKEAVLNFGNAAFGAIAQEERYAAYDNLRDVDYNNPQKLDAILLEWRFPIPGRNCKIDANDPAYQPDLDIQNRIFDIYGNTETKIIGFDLDYKMESADVEKVDWVFETGLKHYFKLSHRGKGVHVEIPFNFNYINAFPVESARRAVVYVGNRYERDWAIDKYLSNSPYRNPPIAFELYGNWLESGRNSDKVWPHINFYPRLQQSSIPYVYRNSAATPLLLKEDYCIHKFMTARIIETVLYGSIPLLIEEFDQSFVEYVPNNLVIKSTGDVLAIAEKSASDFKWRKSCIEFLRSYLSFMDVKHFVDKFESRL